MRVRKFYPRQVAKKLQGKNPQSLDRGDQAALRFFTLRGRKMGVGVTICRTSMADFQSLSREEGEAILNNCNPAIKMQLHA